MKPTQQRAWIRRVLAGITLALLARPAVAGEPYTVQGWRVIDADTLHVETLYLPWGVALNNVEIRMADYDAWEATRIRRSVVITDRELELGRAAKADLRTLLSQRAIRVYPPLDGTEDRDNYGRILAIAYVNAEGKGWVKLADWMRERGHLRQE